MKHTVIKFGLLAFLSGFILFGLPFFLGMGVDFVYGELVGYTAMVLSLLFVYFGIKHFRDKENNGKISFRKSILIGMLITFGAAVGVALFDYIYTSQINPDFASEYTEYAINKMRETLPTEEVTVKAAELKQQMEAYGSPGFMAFMMLASVVIIGFIITLISSLILQRK